MICQPSFNDTPLVRSATLILALSFFGGPAGTIATGAPSLAAQEEAAPVVPSVFETLQGTWEGSGELFGRPAAFHMTWEIMGGGFVHLTFSNALITDAGARNPVLNSQAVYYPQGAAAIGVWVDDRPQRITLDAMTTDSSLVTNWTGETEEGRTEYLIRSDEEIVVRDFVYAKSGELQFAEATYRRATQSTKQ